MTRLAGGPAAWPQIGDEPVTFLADMPEGWFEVQGFPVQIPGFEGLLFVVHPLVITNKKNGLTQLLFGDYIVSEMTSGRMISETDSHSIEDAVRDIYVDLHMRGITVDRMRARINERAGPTV